MGIIDDLENHPDEFENTENKKILDYQEFKAPDKQKMGLKMILKLNTSRYL